MSGLNWADFVIISIIALSSLMSLKRGFFKEALSLASWILAFIIARSFHPNLQTLLVDVVEQPLFRMIAAFAILFVGTLLVGAAIGFIIGALIKMTGLSPLDRLLGVVFGMARGLIITLVMIALIRLTPLAESQWWISSVMIKNLAIIEQWSRSMFESGSIVGL